jgi:acetoacetate decarboxylase
MPESTGFGDYTESGLVIPARFKVEKGYYVHAMCLDDDAPILGGRELWGFPKKLATPRIAHEGDVVRCTLECGSALCVNASVGYKHHIAHKAEIATSPDAPNFLLKIMPHVAAWLAYLHLRLVWMIIN